MESYCTGLSLKKIIPTARRSRKPENLTGLRPFPRGWGGSAKFSSFWKTRLSLSQLLQTSLNNLLFQFLPFTISRFYVGVWGRIYYLLNWPERVLIREAITRVFHGKMPAANLQKIIAEVFGGIFDHYHEKLFIGFSKFSKVLDIFRNQVHFQGREMLQQALAAGHGIILVTGHYGALELLPGALAVNGFPTSMICRFKTTRLRSAQGRRAARLGVDLIDTDKGKSFFTAVKALKAGRILITECDEFEAWRPDCQREIHFLGHKLGADRTLDLLHRRSGAPVIAALVSRDGQQRYTCHLTALNQGAASVNMTVSEQCLKVLETSVQSHPEQWYQWKNFAMLIKTQGGIGNDHQASGYLAPAINLSLPDPA